MINIRMSSALYVFPPTIITSKAKLQNHTLILYLNYKQNGLVNLHGIISAKLICTLQLFHLNMLQFTYINLSPQEMKWLKTHKLFFWGKRIYYFIQEMTDLIISAYTCPLQTQHSPEPCSCPQDIRPVTFPEIYSDCHASYYIGKGIPACHMPKTTELDSE